MKRKKRLVVLHIDGLSYQHLLKGIATGHMPTVKKLIENDNYSILPYTTGIPSTTPFAQAGILYGNNDNIPSFTWFDKQSGIPVRFGTRPTFGKVAHKYFKNNVPLTAKGATIAACYPAGATETFALAYNETKSKTATKRYARRSVLLRWFLNPFHVIDWIIYTILVFVAYFVKFMQTRFNGENVSMKYFFTNLLQEIFLHHMTRYAVVQAMHFHYPVIYAAFYAYDDGSHAFGPQDPFCLSMLRQLDHSINYINKNRLKNKIAYDLLILSDHGQIPTIPFIKKQHKPLGAIVSSWFPTYDVHEFPGIHIPPPDTKQDGEIILTYSGGIGHLYIRTIPGRAASEHIEKILPALQRRLIHLPEIGSLLVKKKNRDVLITKKQTFFLTRKLSRPLRLYLQKFDDPDMLFRQLKRINRFEKAGDIIFFGTYNQGKQINFENQFGGHGAFGGEQMHPFLLLKREWGIQIKNIEGSHKIYHIIHRILQSK